MEIVKLKVLPTSHVGPVMPEPGAGPELTYPKGMVPYTMSCVRMAYHQGTLYADLPPATWASIDQDRAAALGYGERCAWPVNPKRAPPADLPIFKPGAVAQYLNPKADMIRMDPAQQLQALEEARQKKVLMLNAHIYPQSGAFILGRGVRIVSKTPDEDASFSFILTWDTFDRLTVLQLQEHIKNRLK